MTDDQMPSRDDITKAAALLLAVHRELTAVNHKMHLPAARAFLHVAMHEGLSVGEHAKLLEMTPAGTSRLLSDLGARNRRKKDGLDTIEKRWSVVNEARREVYLTPKGAALAHRISKVFAVHGPGLGIAPFDGRPIIAPVEALGSPPVAQRIRRRRRTRA